jgi:hypothetical protein
MSMVRRSLIDSVNLKIKPTQSFEYVYRDIMCVVIGVSARTCMSIYVCTVWHLEKKVDDNKH